jgi:hypothetical protein
MVVAKKSCHVKHIIEVAVEDPFRLKVENFTKYTLKKLRYYEVFTRVRNYNNKKYLRNHGFDKEGSILSNKLKVFNFKPGDIVKVRSKAEILQTLDKRNRLKGCYFMDEMWQYCGTKQRVLKRVDHFFDECKDLMRKTHNIVLLDGLQCSGELGYNEKCDRMCYFFWREEWLEKIE